MTAVLEVPRVPRSVPDWHDEGAACRLFPELDRAEVVDASGKVLRPAFNAWFDSKPGTPEALVAKVVCAACPVRLACAVGALERRERWGIWGGLDYKDRKDVAARFGYLPPGDPPEHGTNSRRVKWGCTCADCRRAHALYEAERRATARRKAKQHGVWLSPLLVLTAPVRVGRTRVGVGQLLLPLPGLPSPRNAEPEPGLLALVA